MRRSHGIGGWVAAATVSAALMAGAAAAAMRGSVERGSSGGRAIPLDLSIGSAEVVAPPPPVASAAPAVPRPLPDPIPPSEVAVPPAPLAAPVLPSPVLPSPVLAPPAHLASPGPPVGLASSPRPGRRPSPSPSSARESQPSPDAAPAPAARAPAGAEHAARPADRRQRGGVDPAAAYADLVMRQVSRQDRATARNRGVVVVGVAIAPDGHLETVRVLRSSGKDDLDRMATEHVRRAAPFPPPPDGPMRFSFEFVAR